MYQSVTLPEQQMELFSRSQLLAHWQGHRSLTRKVIEAFPEDALFHHSVGGMRPFSEMAIELISLTENGMAGIVSREWPANDPAAHTTKHGKPGTKRAILDYWDRNTQYLDKQWSLIPAGRFTESDRAFGEYDGKVWDLIMYWIDNEIHHRAQGFVYLRSLGIEPPYFWDRG